MMVRSAMYQTFLQCQFTETTVCGQTCHPTWTLYPDSELTSLFFFLLNAACLERKGTNTNIIIFAIFKLIKALVCFIYIYYTGSFIPMKKSECIITEKSYIIEVYFVFQTHLKEGYGKLIACYCKLLVEKLNFHRKVLLIFKCSDHE